MEDKTQATYRRGDLFEKRRTLMEDVASYWVGPRDWACVRDLGVHLQAELGLGRHHSAF